MEAHKISGNGLSDQNKSSLEKDMCVLLED